MLHYKNSLERIIEKYSQLEYQDGEEVDLNNADVQSLRNLPDLADVSLRSRIHDVSRKLDLTLQYGGANETCVSSISTQFSAEHEDGTLTRSDTSQLTLSLLDESSQNTSLLEPQPEDMDEELDMTFKSRGCPLVDLYPSMVDRVKQAWDRQHTTQAADLVLRRYHKWRQQPSRSSYNNSLTAPLKHVQHKQIAKKEHPGHSLKICDVPRLPSKAVANQQAWSALQLSPATVRRQPPQPILVMDISGVSEVLNPVKVSLNETFNVFKPSVSPWQSEEYPDLSLRSTRLSLAAQRESVQADRKGMHVTDRPGNSRSPVRQSPLRTQVAKILSRSPRVSSRNPEACTAEDFFREPKRRRAMSESFTSTANMPRREFYAQESHHCFPSQPSSKHSASPSGTHRFRRHLSFDSSPPVGSLLLTPQQLDDEFVKLYHRFVCQNTSFDQRPPCRFCARSAEVGRGLSATSFSSSALAALALSPHRSLLRKRHRELSWDSHPESKRHLELSWDSHPQSKRLRDEYYVSSPGSKRHVKEMLRRRMSWQSCDRMSLSASSSNLLQKFNNMPHRDQDSQMSQSSRMFH